MYLHVISRAVIGRGRQRRRKECSKWSFRVRANAADVTSVTMSNQISVTCDSRVVLSSDDLWCILKVRTVHITHESRRTQNNLIILRIYESIFHRDCGYGQVARFEISIVHACGVPRFASTFFLLNEVNSLQTLSKTIYTGYTLALRLAWSWSCVQIWNVDSSQLQVRRPSQ